MANRAKNAQYAYGITIEAGNYNEVINGFEKRLKDLDKSAKTTTATFVALSEAMKSGKKVDFSKAEGQLTGLVAEMEEVAKWREQLAGGQKLSDMFDGLEQVKQSLGQVTGQLDKFGDNIEEIFSILQNVPQNTSKTFVDIRKVLSQTASDMNKIISELNNPTEKTDVSGLKNQLSSLATDFVNEWNKAAAQGIKMDQVVDFKPFANIIKTAISGARSLGAEFNDVSASVTEATKNVVALYNVKHPTGMFKDMASELSSVENQSKNAEQSASKTVATFKAAVGFVDKIKNSDLGIGKKSKELEDFLAKLQNPQITIKVNKDNVIKEFTALTSKIDEIVSGSVLDIDSNFLKSMSTDKLKELGDTLQNIVAIGDKYKKQLKYLDDLPLFVQTSFKEEMGGYSSDLKSVFAELESRLNEAKQSAQDLSNTLQQMVEKAGLKEIKVELGIKDDIDDYVNKINATITNIEKQSNRIKKIPVMLAFDNNDSDENKNAIETLKQNLGDLKKSIHDARTEINQDTKAIKESLVNALKVNTEDLKYVRSSVEDAFNEKPLDLFFNNETIERQIENILKNHTYDISLNGVFKGFSTPNGGVPITPSGFGSSVQTTGGGIVPPNGSSPVSTSGQSSDEIKASGQQMKASDGQAQAAESQERAAENQAKAAKDNVKNITLMSKGTSEMTAFVHTFAKKYYKTNKAKEPLENKEKSGEKLTEKEEKRLKSLHTTIRNLTPINEYLKGIFGDKFNELYKITEESVAETLTSLAENNGIGGFKGELVPETFTELFDGLKGKYRSAKYKNGIGDLLEPLVGKNGTLSTLFKSFGLNPSTFQQVNQRDYVAPEVLKYYQSFARLADIIDNLSYSSDNINEKLLTELSNILTDLQGSTRVQEYKDNIQVINDQIKLLTDNIKNEASQIQSTRDLEVEGGNIFNTLNDMFKELYSTIGEEAKSAINAAIGTNPSENLIKGDQLIKARDAISKLPGDDASAQIVNDLLRWLDRMISRDNVIISKKKLVDLLGKGQEGAGLKIGVTKNLMRKDSTNGTTKNSQTQGTASSLASSVLKELDADFYYENADPIIIKLNDKVGSKRKKLKYVRSNESKGIKFANGTKIYMGDESRPKPKESSSITESSISQQRDSGKILESAEAELAEISIRYDDAVQKRDEALRRIAEKEKELSKQIEVAEQNVKAASNSLSNVSDGEIFQDSEDIVKNRKSVQTENNISYWMSKMNRENISDKDLKERNILVDEKYKKLLEQRKKLKKYVEFQKEQSKGYAELESKPQADKDNSVVYILDNIKKTEEEISTLKTKIPSDTDSYFSKNFRDELKRQLEEKQENLDFLKKQLNNYKKIQSGENIHENIDKEIESGENELKVLDEQIQNELKAQKSKVDRHNYDLLLSIINQYKERQEKLKGLESDLSNYKEGTQEHDGILIQIDNIKTNLNSMFDEISNISSTLGLDNKDLENAFSGMAANDFFSSKDARTKLSKEVERLSKFKKDSLMDDISIFPPELQEAIKRRNDLLYNKSEIQYINKQLKDLKAKRLIAQADGKDDLVASYKERIDILTERKKGLGFFKNIDPELKELDNTILSYVRSRIDELENISKTDFDISSFETYEVGDAVGGYKKSLSDSSNELSRLNREKAELEKERQHVVSTSEATLLERSKANLEYTIRRERQQINYNAKREEELNLTREISRLEEQNADAKILEQKREKLEEIRNALSSMCELSRQSNKILTSSEFPTDVSPEKKKLFALEEIIKAQKIIAQNTEDANRHNGRVVKTEDINNVRINKETGEFENNYGNPSFYSKKLKQRFSSYYRQTDEYQQTRHSLYESLKDADVDIRDTVYRRVEAVISNTSKNAIGEIVKAKYGEKGKTTHNQVWNETLNSLMNSVWDTVDRKMQQAEDDYVKECADIKKQFSGDKLTTIQKQDMERMLGEAEERLNAKKLSLDFGGESFKEIFHNEAKKFKTRYYKSLANALEIGSDDQKPVDRIFSAFGRSIDNQLNQLNLATGKGKDTKPTEFGKNVNSIFDEADRAIDSARKKRIEEIDKILEEKVSEYLKTITEDNTRLDGEIASDVVFKDNFGNRVNLAYEHRNKNSYNLNKVTAIGQDTKARRAQIEKLREYGGISDEEMKYIQEARDRAYMKVYGGSKSDIENLDLLIGDVDTTPIEEATTSIANQTIKAAAEVAKKSANDKLSTPTVPETASVQQAKQKVAEQVVEGAAQSAKESVSKESKTITKTSAEYKDAVKIVKEAIGSFRGRTDKSKAEFYGTLGKEVKDAANLIYRTPAENRTKEGNALLNKMMGLKNATKISVDTTPITKAVENADNAVVEHATETANTVKKEVENKKKTVSTESLKDLLLSDPSKVLEIAKSDPERVRRELFSYLEQYVSNIGETVQSFLQSWSNNINGLGSTNAAKVASYYFSEPYQFSTIFDSSYSGKLYQVGQNDAYLSRRLGLLPIESLSSLSSFGEVFKNIDIWQDIFDTLYPNNLNKIDFSKVDTTELQQYIEALIKDHIRTYMTGLLHIGRSKLPENDEPIYDGYGNVIDNVSNEMASRGQELKEKALSNLSKIFPGISEEDITKALKLPIKTPDEWDRISTFPTKKDTKSIQFMDTAFNNFLSTFGVPNMKDILGLAQEAVKDGAEKIVQKSTESAQQAISQGVEETELSDAKKLKLAKKELQNRIDTAKEIAQDGTKSKSKEVIKSGSVPSAQNPEYVFNEGVESTSEFVKEVWNLTEAFKAGANAANIEYGFATQNGKRIQLAKGDNGSVDFQRFYGDVDSLTHSHSYTKGLNNMVFSLEDINQLEQLGTRNNLKKYNLIYDNEMMSLNLGKNSQEAAEAIADCYPQINDVVMAMLSREDGNSIPAENTEEMARILNGYLQKVVEDAGGRLSVVNSKGENVTSKYSITDDEYSKLNNILAKSQNYYNDNFGTVSKSDYVSVIRQYIAEEFGKEFMANVRAKSDANPHGGVYTEFSAIPEYDDEDKKMLDYAEQVTLYSKKIVAAEKTFVESLQKMSNEDLMAFIKQGEETLGIKKEPEVKPTLTNAQIAALNPDDVTALQKASIKQFSKVRNWNENNVGNIEGFLGADNKTLVAYKTQFEELAKIALDLKTKGESGTIITKDDISQLDIAISKTKELQTVLTKEAQFKQMKDAGLIVSGKTKIKSTDSYSERQDIMAQYAKKYAAQNKSEYQFGQYDFINDKISFNMIDSAGQVTKVIMGWSDAFNTAYIQSSKLQGSLDKITQEIYKTDEAIKAGEDYGFFKGQSDGVKEYNDALKEYEAQVRAVAKSSQKDLDKNFEALHAAQVKVINAGKNLLDKQKDAFGFNSAQKVLGREGNIDATLQSYRDQGINVDDIKLVKNYNDAIGALKQKLDELKQSGKLWDSNEQAGLKVLADHAAEAEKAILKADEAQRQLKGDLITGAEAKFFEGVDPKDTKQVEQAMKQYARSIKGVDALSIKWNEEQRTLTYSVRTGKHEVSDFALTMGKYTDACYKARTGTRTVQTGMEKFLTSIKGKFQEVARYIISFGSFYRIWAEIQKGVTYVREIDSALTELKKVTDETDETYAKFLKTMAQTGSEVGATVQDLTNMAASWARLGYSIEQAGELAKSTAVLLNVSEFTDADTASEALISTIQAYGYAAEDSMHVVDVLNEIGNSFAISSDGIATALQDSASSLMAAGNNLEQSVAMIAAANKVLQDPNSVGAALRTISLRIRGTSVKV